MKRNKDFRAELNIKALHPNGEDCSFSAYEYNIENMKEADFNKYVKDNALLIANKYCDSLGADFVAIKSIDFEYITMDD